MIVCRPVEVAPLQGQNACHNTSTGNQTKDTYLSMVFMPPSGANSHWSVQPKYSVGCGVTCVLLF